MASAKRKPEQQQELALQAGELSDDVLDAEECDAADDGTSDSDEQPELFICDISDVNIKDTRAQLEHPVYSLSKNPVRKTIRYENNGALIELKPGVDGLPTIYDKDIIIYIVSQMVTRSQRENIKPSKYLRINAHQLLTFTRRGTGGASYKALEQGLDRLQQTQIKTNIRSGKTTIKDRFSLIDRATSKYTNDDPDKGRMTHVDIVLSDWLFNAIKSTDVLTLAPSYFELKKPVYRRIYEIARKHCGAKRQWAVTLDVLFKRTGSSGKLESFRFLLKKLVKENSLPDYLVTLEIKEDKKGKKTEMIVFTNRDEMPNAVGSRRKRRQLPSEAPLNPQTVETARSLLPVGTDVYDVIADFREHLKANQESVWSIDAQLLSYVAAHKLKPKTARKPRKKTSASA